MRYVDPDGRFLKIRIPNEFDYDIPMTRNDLDALGASINSAYQNRTLTAKICNFFGWGDSIENADNFVDIATNIIECAGMVFDSIGKFCNAKTIFQMIFPDTISETYDNFNKFYFRVFDGTDKEVTDIKINIKRDVTVKSVAGPVSSSVVVTTTTTSTLSALVNGEPKVQEINVEKQSTTYLNCKLLGD